MSRAIWIGAVAYDPKVVTIWEGMRRYFHEETHLPVEVVLFQSYEAQVGALLAGPNDVMPRVDIAWNTTLRICKLRRGATTSVGRSQCVIPISAGGPRS
jgi:phosphonate transport system substrate-binding protein